FGAFVLVALAAATRMAAARGQSFEQAAKHWAYQPIRSPAAPKVRSSRAVRSPLDAFLLSKLEAKGLIFAPPTDKRTLLRRVYYDLIGLLPTYEHVQGSEKDHSRNAIDGV